MSYQYKMPPSLDTTIICQCRLTLWTQPVKWRINGFLVAKSFWSNFISQGFTVCPIITPYLSHYMYQSLCLGYLYYKIQIIPYLYQWVIYLSLGVARGKPGRVMGQWGPYPFISPWCITLHPSISFLGILHMCTTKCKIYNINYTK